MATPALLPSQETGDFNAEGSYIGPQDAIDDILSDIIDGKPARAKIDRLKAGGNIVRFEKPARRKTKTSLLDEVVEELAIEGREAIETATEGRKGKSVDALLDSALGLVDDEDDVPAQKPARVTQSDEAPVYDINDVHAAEVRGQIMAAMTHEFNELNGQIADFRQVIAGVAAEFPDIQSPVDVIHLASTDFQRHGRFQMLQRMVAEMAAALEQRTRDASSLRMQAFGVLAQHEDAIFQSRHPKWSSDDAFDLKVMLNEFGLSDEELKILYLTPQGAALGDPRALRILETAARHHTGATSSKDDVLAAVVETLRDAGFSDADIQALANGAPISMRDHRIQEVLLWALEGRR